jgi:hypothetical protein
LCPFCQAIERLQSESQAVIQARVTAARTRVVAIYDWSEIAAKMAHPLQELTNLSRKGIEKPY